MNLTDIDLSKATPIDFDDIREGDTVLALAGDYFEGGKVTSIHTNAVGTGTDGWVETGNDVSWFLLDRPEPPRVKPGTTGTAAVRGVKGVRVMRVTNPAAGEDYWSTARLVQGHFAHLDLQVADFVPDPAPGMLPQDVKDALEELVKACPPQYGANMRPVDYFLRAVVGDR